MTEIPTVPLSSGGTIPQLGIGTSRLQGREGADAIADALRAGYRLIDTAAQYNNETAVGVGLRDSGVHRDEVVLTTKVAGGSQGRDATRTGVAESLRRLGVDHVDIVLIHWPNPSRGLAVETWTALLDLQSEGLVRTVGVSNFLPEQLLELHGASGVWPALNQIQLSPALPRHDSVAFHRDHDIVTEAWGPLGTREGLLDQFVLRTIAAKHDVTPALVALRWGVQQGYVVIPKSSSLERQRENLRVADFALDAEDMQALETLGLGEEDAWDARTHEEW